MSDKECWYCHDPIENEEDDCGNGAHFWCNSALEEEEDWERQQAEEEREQ